MKTFKNEFFANADENPYELPVPRKWIAFSDWVSIMLCASPKA